MLNISNFIKLNETREGSHALDSNGETIGASVVISAINGAVTVAKVLDDSFVEIIQASNLNLEECETVRIRRHFFNMNIFKCCKLGVPGCQRINCVGSYHF